MTALIQLADDLWEVRRPLSFYGLELGTRMTVIRFGRDLLLHSPVAPDDALRQALAALGEVRWVVGPNRFHHLFLAPWVALGAEAWGVPARVRKRGDLAFAGVGTPLLTRAMMRAAWGYPGACCSLLERSLMKCDAARRDLGRILAWEIDRVVLAHGENITDDAAGALRRAYEWLGLERS